MKEKFYTFNGKSKDKNGIEHIVTIVGKFTQEKVDEFVTKEINVEDEKKDNKYVKGLITYPVRKKKRTLTYAVSICHPDDEFNEDEGIRIAKKRIEEKPLGQLQTTLVTTLCEDQINFILFGELNYVINNIDKFI